MTDIKRLTLLQLKDRLQSGELTVTEAVHGYLEQIEKTEPRLQALLNVQRDQVLQQAEKLDKKGPEKDKPLWGIPLVIKDVLTTKDVPTTCASKILENYVPYYDATVVKKLKDAGAMILAKSNMDEFAMGSSNENSAFAMTKNPWNTQCVPGGSSGGSAASVAAFQCPSALGTDTGGSIRQPASFCGVVGMKPTYGRVSRFGLVAFGTSLDQVGPMTRNVADNAALMQIIAGHDPRDSTSVKHDVPDYLSALSKRSDLEGITIGIPQEFWSEGMAPEVESSCRAAIETAENLGARTVDVSIPSMPYGIAAYYIIAPAEASSNLARFDGVRYGYRDTTANDLIEMYTKTRSKGFGDEVQRRIMLGTYVLSSGYYDAYYRKAAQVRRLLYNGFTEALSRCDVIFAPTSPTTAFKIGELTDDPLQMYLMDVYTIPLNLTGLPGMCLPIELGSQSKLPVGLQLIGPGFGEEKLYEVAHVLEQHFTPLPDPSDL